MQTWLEAWLRDRLHTDEKGAIDLLVVLLLAFVIWLIVGGHRVVVQ